MMRQKINGAFDVSLPSLGGMSLEVVKSWEPKQSSLNSINWMHMHKYANNTVPV